MIAAEHIDGSIGLTNPYLSTCLSEPDEIEALRRGRATQASVERSIELEDHQLIAGAAERRDRQAVARQPRVTDRVEELAHRAPPRSSA